mgnify:CR=1 FL=1
MRVLLATDVFPPRCGGAGWSSFHLARALQQRGHTVLVVVPCEGGKGHRRRSYGGIAVQQFAYGTPRLPLLRNLFRNEFLWPRLGRFLAESARQGHFDLIHAQHSLTIPAAVHAGRICHIPVVATVRDYWAICYRSTLLGHSDQRCLRCGMLDTIRCLGQPLKGLAPLAVLAYPYVRGNVRRKARALARADAVVAVSRFVAGRLSDIVPPERLHVLPNMVDLEEIGRIIAVEPAGPSPGPFLLFVGKVEGNKGARELRDVLDRAASVLPGEERLPLVIAGDGAMAHWLEVELAGVGWPALFLRWADHDEVLRLLARTELLLFPSRWDEPLSRVLLEACACGAPILAMATGGTAETLADGVSGALVPPDVEAFVRRLLGLLHDPAERQRLGAGARRAAEERFAVPVVAGRVEELYATLRHRPA